MEVKGKVKFVGKDQDVSASFMKRELVVTTEEQYPQHILINFVQDKCRLLDNLNVGEDVSVSINLRGREWVNPQGETKYFNDIQGWRVSRVNTNAYQAGQAAPQTAQPTQPQQAFEPAADFKEEDHDDLPF